MYQKRTNICYWYIKKPINKVNKGLIRISADLKAQMFGEGLNGPRDAKYVTLSDLSSLHLMRRLQQNENARNLIDSPWCAGPPPSSLMASPAMMLNSWCKHDVKQAGSKASKAKYQAGRHSRQVRQGVRQALDYLTMLQGATAPLSDRLANEFGVLENSAPVVICQLT